MNRKPVLACFCSSKKDEQCQFDEATEKLTDMQDEMVIDKIRSTPYTRVSFALSPKDIASYNKRFVVYWHVFSQKRTKQGVLCQRRVN